MKSYRFKYSCVLLLTALCCGSLRAQVMTLSQCRQMAVENSNAVRNANIDYCAAKEQKGEALWAYLPSVSAGALAFHAIDPLVEISAQDIFGPSELLFDLTVAANNIGISTSYTALEKGVAGYVGLMQPVYAGGRIVNGNRLASLGVEAAKLQADIAMRDIGDEVEKDYWQIVSLQEKKVTLQQAIALIDTLYGDVSSAHAAGLVSDNDYRLVELRRSSFQNDMMRLDNGLLLTKMYMCNIIGKPYVVVPDSATIDTPYVGSIVFSADFDLLNSPDHYYRDENEICGGMEEFKLLDINEKANSLKRQMTLGEALPEVGIGASYSYSNLFEKDRFNGMVFASVRVPITDWGKTAHRLRRQDYQLQKARNDKEYLSEQLLLRVRQLWLEANNAWQQMQVGQQVEETAKSRMNSVGADYRAGIVSLTDYLQAQMEYRQSMDSLIDAKIAYRTAIQRYIDVQK